MPLDVQCWGCGGIFHETNDEDGWIKLDDGGGEIPNPRVKRFFPDKPATGSMFKLKEPYTSYGWDTFPHDESVTGEALECPSCGAPYVNASGKVQVVRQRLIRGERQAAA
ncbi:MAG TPA: hypothetical protein DCE18_19490 [Syntrophobacteraceae bacterium]|jgi:hypothetical protein|nr:hypothetical protein [Syntrophobacteraceae bacterium]